MLLVSVVGGAACSEHAVVAKRLVDNRIASGKKVMRFILSSPSCVVMIFVGWVERSEAQQIER
jgi:hypothetical protein